MSTTTKNVGRVSIVPKGDWNINNTYIRLDLVTYNGNSYIAKKDVPKNIQLSNNNYWMLMASKGASFAIVKSYASIAAMNADFSNTNVQNGQFVIIDTGNVQDPDNAKLYYKGSNSYVFVTDMSGATGIQGPRGASAYEQAVAGGYTGTETQFNEDLANFSELSEQAADSAAAAAQSESNAAGSATTATTKAGEAANSAAQALASMNSADASAQAAANSATSAELNSSAAFEFAKQASGSSSTAKLQVREAQGYVRDAKAYAIGKRDDIDVSITDQAYHNNAKYYAEQAALVVNNVEQTMTATTIDSVTLATFNASIADMPFKELTIDIEPVQTAGTPSPETPLPITGQTGCNIYHSQYNLIDQSIVTNATNWAVSTDTEFSDYNGAPVFKGAISNLYNKFNYYSKRIPVKVQPGKRYVFRLWWRSVDANTNNGLRMRLWYDDQTYTDSSSMAANQTWKSITLISDTNKTPAGIGFQYNYNYSIYLAGLMCVDYEQYMALGSDQTTFVCPNDRQTYSITFPTEAGTVYGGTLDVVNGVLKVTHAITTVSAKTWRYESNYTRFNAGFAGMVSGKYGVRQVPFMCSGFQSIDDGRALASVPNNSIYGAGTSATVFIKTDTVSTVEDFISTYGNVQILYELESPIDITISPTEITTLLGNNNIWADIGDVTVTYGAYLETVKFYADKVVDSAAAAEAVLASIPDDYTELSDKVDNLNNTFFAEYGVTTYNEIDTHVKDGNLVVLKQNGLLDGGSYFTVLSGTSFGEVAGFPWNGYIFTKPAVAFGDTVSYTRITCGSDNEWTTENAEVRNINTDIVGTFYYANAYNIGDYVQQNSKIYRFVAPHTAGSYWNTSEVVEVVLTNEIDKISEDVAELRSAVAPEANFNFVHVISTQQPAPYNALSTVFDCGLYGVRGSEGYMSADAPAGFSGGSLLILPAYQERTTQGTPLNQTQKIQMLIDPVNKKIWMRYANASNTWRDWFVADMSMPVTALATATPNANGFTSSSFVAGGISEAGGNSSNSHRIRSVYIAKDDKTSIRYVIPDGYRLQIAFYSNNSGTQVGRTNWITGDGRIGFPEGCNYFRLQFASIDDATDLTSAADYNRISIEYGYELIDYSPFITTQTRWLALGDSITYGVCSSGASASSEGTSWAAFLAASLGYVFKNMGVRGMGYVTSGSNGVTWANTLDNIDALTDDYNLITIMLGINDYNNSNATLDNIADALNTGITRIITKYPNARLVVFTPFNARNRGTADTLYDYGFAFPESNPRTLKDIADKIGEVCDSRGIEWHNVSNGCLLNPSNMTGLLLDSIHPSQDCHKLLSKAMARYLIY